ncbi:PUM1 protein [Rhizoctonia solani AG-1 IA]|uniref:PUM1 protein n=1 Tax=Thanatephorus cucumeris (strain AG1-IA) TaxID=983506 RepID=L8X498_THACA|nr:PUM1 protein [Rhizoctonia solani AG-1 IA]
MPVAIPPSYRMGNSGPNSRKPSGSSAHSGVHSPARESPDPMTNTQGHRNLSPNSAAMLGAGKYNGWPGWNSPAASSDNLTNRTASISSSSSPVDFAPLTDFPHCSPLNTAWDLTRQAQAQALGQRGYSPNTGAEWELDIIHAEDQDAELATVTNGMRSLGVDDRSPKLVQKNGPLHGRAVSYAGALGVSDVQHTGMPMPVPHPASNVRSASLHHQRSDPSIAQSYSYGQPAAHDYGVYYSNVPSTTFSQYSYGASADPAVFGSPVPSNAPHRTSYGIPGYSTPSYYPDATQAASSYYYNQGIVYSPQMGHAPMPGAMHSPVPGVSRSKQDLRGGHFGRNSQLSHQQRMLISAMPPGTAPIGVPSEPFSQYPVSNQLFGLGQGLGAMLHSQPTYGFPSASTRPVLGFAPLRHDLTIDPSATGRSPLLEQFRADKSKTWQLRDIRGHVAEFCGDQHGSRFIQQKLETATDEEKEGIFSELAPGSFLPLMTDVFGNYVSSHRLALWRAICYHFRFKCMVAEWSRRYAGLIAQPHVADLTICVSSRLLSVIQKLIERVSPDLLGFVSVFQGNVYDLATHPYGCRVLQRCFEYLHESQTRPLIDELHKYTTQLMQDQFGNYVIQFVLEHGAAADRDWILHKLRGQMVQMARHKFASNVCEKALVTADSESRRLLIDEIMTPRMDTVNPIVLMMKDSFASDSDYVLQRALQVVEGEQRHVLVAKVKPQLANMRRYSSAYSKHLASKASLRQMPPHQRLRYQVSAKCLTSFALCLMVAYVLSSARFPFNACYNMSSTSSRLTHRTRNHITAIVSTGPICLPPPPWTYYCCEPVLKNIYYCSLTLTLK